MNGNLIKFRCRYSLPEMTNGNGEYNIFSCRAQAWSIACILEAISEYE